MKKSVICLLLGVILITSVYAGYAGVEDDAFSVSPMQLWFHTTRGEEETGKIQLRVPLDPNCLIENPDDVNYFIINPKYPKLGELFQESMNFEISFLTPKESGIDLASFCRVEFNKIKFKVKKGKKGKKEEIPIKTTKIPLEIRGGAYVGINIKIGEKGEIEKGEMEKGEVVVKIKVPSSAKVGTYLGLLKIHPIPPKGMVLKSSTSPVIKTYLLVKGDGLRKEMDLTVKPGVGLNRKDPLKKFFLVESGIKNSGNVFFVVAELKGVIRNKGGKVVDLSFESQGGTSKTVMPGTGPKFLALVPELALGNYQALIKGVCSYGGTDTEEKEVTVNFVVDPNISRLVWGKVISPFKVEPASIELALHPKAKKRVKYITLQNDSDVEMEVTEIRLPPFVELTSSDHPPFKVDGWKSKKIKIFVNNELNGEDVISGDIIVATSDGCKHKILVTLTKKGGSDEGKGTDYFKSNRGNFLCWMR